MLEPPEETNFNLNFKSTTLLLAFTAVAIVTGLFITAKTNLLLNSKIAAAKEAARPSNIDIIILKDSNCADCFNINEVVNLLKKEQVKVNSEKIVEMTSKEGIELIEKYKISKAPTLIISGELNKHTSFRDLLSKIGQPQDNAFIIEGVGAPYILTDSGDVRGRANFIMLSDQKCAECYDVTRHENILKRFGFFQDGKVIDAFSPEGQKLIRKYKIKLLPTFILTGDLDIYSSLKSIWPQVGTAEKDGAYVFREGVKEMGAYKDLSLNKIIKSSEDAQN